MTLDPQPNEPAFAYMLRTLRATAPAHIRPLLGPEVLAEALARSMGELIETNPAAQQTLLDNLKIVIGREIASQSRERN